MTATPYGLSNRAVMAGPSAKPAVPLPASVVAVPVGGNETKSIVFGVSNDNAAVFHYRDAHCVVELSSRGRPVREASCAAPSKCRDGTVEGRNKTNPMVEGI